MEKEDYPSFNDAVKFHGHVCPGLALGYAAARRAMRELGVARPRDEECVAIVENDACGVDAIQFVCGCTIGKGNLILRDWGKHAYTFINRSTGEGVRIAELPSFSMERIDPEFDALRRQVRSGGANEEERREFGHRMKLAAEAILALPEEEIFSITPVRVEVPEKARIFRSVTCARCGELVAEPKARLHEGRILCIPCVGAETTEPGD